MGGRRAESKPESENVYYMRRHLLAGGSALLEGDCFSISPRQSSNTLAVDNASARSESVGWDQLAVAD